MKEWRSEGVKRTRSEGECRGRGVKESVEGGQRGDRLRTEEETERETCSTEEKPSKPPYTCRLGKKKIIKINQSINSAQYPPNKRLDLIRCRNIYIINIWYEIVASPSECQKEREGAEPVVSNSTDRPDHTERE
ncbi:MAG: hypothetical protein ACK5PF_00030 [bacterium]